MAKPILWIVLGVLVLFLLIAAFALQKKKKRKPDYYVFFIMGLIWLPFGIIMDNSVLWIMGLLFMIVGLAHKKEWKKNRLTWDKLDKNEKKIRAALIIFLALLVLTGIVFYFLAQKGLI